MSPARTSLPLKQTACTSSIPLSAQCRVFPSYVNLDSWTQYDVSCICQELARHTRDEEVLLKALSSGGDCWRILSPWTCRQVFLQEVKHLYIAPIYAAYMSWYHIVSLRSHF